MAYGNLAVDTITTSTGQVVGASSASSMKNRLINGAMTFWQRGTSSSSTGYLADRWNFYADSSRTFARSTDVPSGFQYSSSLTGTGSTGLTQYIESVNCADLGAQTITVSFWLKQTSGAGTNAIALNLYYASTTDATYSTRIGTQQQFNTTSSWQQYSATFTALPSSVANGIQVTIVTTSGSAVTFLVTGVQVELGASPTSYEYRHYGQELRLCLRYYEIMNDQYYPLHIPYGYSLYAAGYWRFLEPKRATPTVSDARSVTGTTFASAVDQFGQGSFTPTSMQIDSPTQYGCRIALIFTGSLGTAGTTHGDMINIQKSGFFQASAEL